MDEQYTILERCPGNRLRVKVEAIPEILAVLAVFQHRFEAGVARADRMSHIQSGPGNANNATYYKNAVSAITDVMSNIRNPIREANLRVGAICITPLVRRMLAGWTPGSGMPLELPHHEPSEPDRREGLQHDQGGGGTVDPEKPRGKGHGHRPGRGRKGDR